MSLPMIDAPAGFVPQFALSFGTRAGPAQAVDRESPLPTQAVVAAASAAPLVGSSAQSAAIGPFVPDLGRAIWVTLSGEWTGSVAVQRSTDDGATLRPLTVAGSVWASFTGNVQEPVGEESVAGASWWLVFQRGSGTLAYEVRQ